MKRSGAWGLAVHCAVAAGCSPEAPLEPGPPPSSCPSYAAGEHRGRVAGDVRIYVVPEPSVALEQPLSVGTIEGAFLMTLTYPDRAQDAETLLIDPDSGALFIVTKSVVGQSGVYRKAAPHRAGDVAELEWVAALDLTEPPFSGSLFITAGDVSPSGAEVVLRTYDAAYVVPRGEGVTLAEALAHNTPCPVLVEPEVQGEAIAFAADGAGLFTVSENPEQDPDAPQPLWFYRAE